MFFFGFFFNALKLIFALSSFYLKLELLFLRNIDNVFPTSIQCLQHIFAIRKLIFQNIHLLGIILQLAIALQTILNQTHLFLESMGIVQLEANELADLIFSKLHHNFISYNIMKVGFVFLVFLMVFAVQSRKRSTGSYSARPRRMKGFGIMKGVMDELSKKDVSKSRQHQNGFIEQPQSSLVSGKVHVMILSYVRSSWTLLAICLLGFLGILWLICCRNQNQDVDIDYGRIKQRRMERQKRDQLMEAIKQHGVHPERAKGNIYRIRL